MSRLPNVQYVTKNEKKLLKFTKYRYFTRSKVEFRYINRKLEENNIWSLFLLLDHLHYDDDDDTLKDIHNLVKSLNPEVSDFFNDKIMTKMHKIITKLYKIKKSNLIKALRAENHHMCELESEIDEDFDSEEEYEKFLEISVEIKKTLADFIRSFEI